MLRLGLIAVSVVLVLGSAQGHTRQRAPGAASSFIAHDDFMKLSVDQRRDRFGELSAENKSLIVRTHAKRWLATQGKCWLEWVAEDLVDYLPDVRR